MNYFSFSSITYKVLMFHIGYVKFTKNGIKVHSYTLPKAQLWKCVG